MFKLKYLTISIILVLALSLTGLSLRVSASPLAAIPPSLGVASSFAVLGASAVTNTGPSVLNGDLGIWPGTASSITGFPPGILTGTIHAADGVAHQAQNDVTAAFNALASQACDSVLTGQDLGGLTLTPGVYCFSSSAQLTGTLTLNAQGDPNAAWIFKIGSAITTASGSSVTFINSGSGPGCNVFWQVGSSATLGTTTQFIGNILASASITMNTNANLSGRALAQNAAVTLDTNNITPVFCSAQATTTPTTTVTSTTTITKTTTTTPTISKTPTTSTTPTISQTPTTSITPTISKTPTTSMTPTISQTPTVTPRISMTPTVSQTPTTTPKITATVTMTVTMTTTPTITATATHLPVVTGLPPTGGGPIRNDNFPWGLAIAGGFGAIILVLGIRAYRRAYLPKQ